VLKLAYHILAKRLVAIVELVFLLAQYAFPLHVEAALRASLECSRMSTAIVTELGLLSALFFGPARGLGLRELFAGRSREHDGHDE
jgi:hypothetical protein